MSLRAILKSNGPSPMDRAVPRAGLGPNPKAILTVTSRRLMSPTLSNSCTTWKLGGYAMYANIYNILLRNWSRSTVIMLAPSMLRRQLRQVQLCPVFLPQSMTHFMWNLWLTLRLSFRIIFPMRKLHDNNVIRSIVLHGSRQIVQSDLQCAVRCSNHNMPSNVTYNASPYMPGTPVESFRRYPIDTMSRSRL